MKTGQFCLEYFRKQKLERKSHEEHACCFLEGRIRRYCYRVRPDRRPDRRRHHRCGYQCWQGSGQHLQYRRDFALERELILVPL